jgi:hypothetical protein
VFRRALRAVGAGAADVETAIGPAKIEITIIARRNEKNFLRKRFMISPPKIALRSDEVLAVMI